MLRFIARRVLLMIPIMFMISVIIFIVIQLPPGDFVDITIAGLRSSGAVVDESTITNLRAEYGLDRPMIVQYLIWIENMVLRGNFGYSFFYRLPVSELIASRIPLSLLVSAASILFIWIIGFPIGVYAATHQYSAGDYTISFMTFIGAATPAFLLALVLMWIMHSWFDASVGGLFSTDMISAAWSFKKFLDLLAHLWIPIVVVGITSTAGLIRTLRANMLDEISKPYVKTAKSKGVTGRRLLVRYPLRMALIPFTSTVGWTLPALFSGEVITSIVLNVPTMGPLLLSALKNQDMYLAGSIVLILSLFTVVGTMISDILLVLVDPRIKFE